MDGGPADGVLRGGQVELGLLIRGDRSWRDTLAIARHAEATGWDSLWYPDHFMPFAGALDLPYNEGWTAVAALAALVPRVRIGHMVSCIGYRHPAVTAKMAAGIDQISGGRFVLGLGSGSQANEHHAYGLPFPPLRERMERLAEACAIVRGLFDQSRTTFRGRYFSVEDAPLEPKGVGWPIPLLVGTNGPRRGLRIVAEHANEWNFAGSAGEFASMRKVLFERCEEIGRDPASIRQTVLTTLQLTEDEDAPPLRYFGLETPTLSGSAEALALALRAYAQAGCDELVIGDMSFGEDASSIRGGMERFREEVLGRLQFDPEFLRLKRRDRWRGEGD